jgi:hypothetical protein
VRPPVVDLFIIIVFRSKFLVLVRCFPFPPFWFGIKKERNWFAGNSGKECVVAKEQKGFGCVWEMEMKNSFETRTNKVNLEFHKKMATA